MNEQQLAILEAVKARQKAAKAAEVSQSAEASKQQVLMPKAPPVAVPQATQAATPVQAQNLASYGEGVNFDPRTGLPSTAGQKSLQQAQMAIRGAAPAIGSIAGPAGTVAGAALGEYAANKLEGKDTTAGDYAFSTVLSLVPAANLAGAGVKRTLLEALKFGGTAAVASTARSLIDKGELPSGSEIIGDVAGGAIGAGASRLASGVGTAASAAFERNKTLSEGVAKSVENVRNSGYKLPSVASPTTGAADTGITSALLKASSPHIETKFIIENQKNTNKLAAKFAGIPGQAITEENLAKAAKPHNEVYAQLESLGEDAKKDLKLFKAYRDKYNKEIRDSKVPGHSEKYDMAMKSKEAMDEYEKRLEAHAAYNENPKLYDKFQEARTALAKINATREATNTFTGEVDARDFAKMYDRNRLLSDEGLQIAQMAGAFPDFAIPASKVVQIKLKGPSALTNITQTAARYAPVAAGAHLGGGAGAMAGAALTGVGLAGKYGMQKAADAALLSKYYQMSPMAKQKYATDPANALQQFSRFAGFGSSR